MTDTRCADPDLQLDVDLMVLEYTLFQATKAQFDLILSGGQDPDKASDATRLVTVFDTLVRLFNINHAAHGKSSMFLFNLAILELLVLISRRESTVPPQFADAMTDQLSAEARRNLERRRRWLAARASQSCQRGKQRAAQVPDRALGIDVENDIYRSWEGPISTYDSLPTDVGPLLSDLLPRFMDLSAKIAALLGVPNRDWMKIACEFILQASFEALQLRLLHGDHESLPRLEDCFAWGYVDPQAYDDIVGRGASLDRDHVNRTTTLEDEEEEGEEEQERFELLNNLFDDNPSDSQDDETTLSENPQWTQIRAEYLLKFSLDGDTSREADPWILDLLQNSYPLADFQQRLVTFVQYMWQLTCEDEIHGKPILVQIEEGHLQSLGIEGGPDFDAFLARVGVRDDVDGSMRLKL